MPLKSIIGVDHVVIAVRDLDQSAKLWEGLGFTVSPRGLHSAILGTANNTIMFQDDYLELLGVVANTERNNSTRSFLKEREGIERTAFTAHSADKGAAEIKAMGYEPVGPIYFSRPVPLPEGKTGEAKFSVFRWPLDQRPGGMAIFACQHHTRETVWLPELMKHANGAVAIEAIEIVAADPLTAAAKMADMIKRSERYDRASRSFRVASGKGRADFVFSSPEVFAARHPAAAEGATKAGAAALVVATKSLSAAKKALGEKAVITEKSVVVPAKAANGVGLVFVKA